MNFVGKRTFHEGTRWGVLGDLFELLVNKESFHVYHCDTCGKVEFFIPPTRPRGEGPSPAAAPATTRTCIKCLSQVPLSEPICPQCGMQFRP